VISLLDRLAIRNFACRSGGGYKARSISRGPPTRASRPRRLRSSFVGPRSAPPGRRASGRASCRTARSLRGCDNTKLPVTASNAPSGQIDRIRCHERDRRAFPPADLQHPGRRSMPTARAPRRRGLRATPVPVRCPIRWRPRVSANATRCATATWAHGRVRTLRPPRRTPVVMDIRLPGRVAKDGRTRRANDWYLYDRMPQGVRDRFGRRDGARAGRNRGRTARSGFTPLWRRSSAGTSPNGVVPTSRSQRGAADADNRRGRRRHVTWLTLACFIVTAVWTG
jgi:hypothetical protein